MIPISASNALKNVIKEMHELGDVTSTPLVLRDELDQTFQKGDVVLNSAVQDIFEQKYLKTTKMLSEKCYEKKCSAV